MRTFILLLSAPAILLLSSCKREADPAAEALEEARRELREMRKDLERAQEGVAAREEQLKRERSGMLEQLKAVEKLQVETYEGQVVREEALDEREVDSVLKEEVLLQWEEALDDREQELAGQEALLDWIPEEPEVFDEPVADYDLFYDELDDYGSWYESEDYGYVYQPLIVVQDNSWRPYTCGRWRCTSQGWCWVSDEPFGWACYHYGRWCKMPRRGWCWVPGKKWAPSWCAWREGADHVGWAPLPPESMAGRGRAWGRGTDRELCIPDEAFCFVESRHMADRAWRHCLPSGRNAYLRARTRCCTNLYGQGGRVIAGGPRWSQVRKNVGRPWPVLELEFDPIGGLSADRARHGFARGKAWRVFSPSIDAPWNLRLRPDRLAGRIDGLTNATEGRSDVWASRLRETRELEGSRAQGWSGPVAGGLTRNRESVAAAQPDYEACFNETREALNARPRQPRAEREELAATDESPREPSRPRANMPPALGRLLPPGVVPLPESGRSVEESIVARAERPGLESPVAEVRSVPVVEVVTPSSTEEGPNQRGDARESGGSVATIGRPLPEPMPRARPQPLPTHPVPVLGQESSTPPPVVASQNPSPTQDATPTRGPAVAQQQAQAKEMVLRQQRAVQATMAAQRQIASNPRNQRVQPQTVSRGVTPSVTSSTRATTTPRVSQGRPTGATSQVRRTQPTAPVTRRTTPPVRSSAVPSRSGGSSRGGLGSPKPQTTGAVRGRFR